MSFLQKWQEKKVVGLRLLFHKWFNPRLFKVVQSFIICKIIKISHTCMLRFQVFNTQITARNVLTNVKKMVYQTIGVGSLGPPGIIARLLSSVRKNLNQKYSRLRCLLRVKGLVICLYLGWSGSTLLITKHILKVGSKS